MNQDVSALVEERRKKQDALKTLLLIISPPDSKTALAIGPIPTESMREMFGEDLSEIGELVCSPILSLVESGLARLQEQDEMDYHWTFFHEVGAGIRLAPPSHADKGAQPIVLTALAWKRVESQDDKQRPVVEYTRVPRHFSVLLDIT